MICQELAHKAVEKVQEVPPHPCSIKLVLKRYLDREIKDSENGMLASELLLKAGDKFVVSVRGNENMLNLTLLEPGTQKLTARAKENVRKLWKSFSVTDIESTLEHMDTEAVKRMIAAVSDKTSLQPRSIMAYNTNEDANKLLYTDFLSYYE